MERETFTSLRPRMIDILGLSPVQVVFLTLDAYSYN